MKKYHLFLAASAGLFLAGCSSDEFMGEAQLASENGGIKAISFGGDAQHITRSTDNDIAKLNGQFVVYGVKSGATAGSNMQKVFVDYWVWNNLSGATANTTNRYGWDYVGAKDSEGHGASGLTLDKDQTIKYWDLTAADYRFVAGSPVGAFSFTLDENNNITGATVTKIDAHINANPMSGDGTALSHSAVYVANPLIINPSGQTNNVNNYESSVTFQFTGQQALVRVGLYETIPGYNVSNVNFYTYDIDSETLANSKWSATAGSKNIVLNSLTDDDYFIGGSNMTATLTYNWTGTPSYSFHYNSVGNTKQNKWYGGYFAESAQLPTTSSTTTLSDLYGTDKDMALSTGYFPVLPTATGTTPTALVIKCDYTLTSVDASGETIEIMGATAAIPAAFSQWEQNHAYTYLFKISDKTAGTSGVLYPIQFDAAVVNGADNRDGFITTVSVPSITSYQFQSPNTEYNADGSFKETYIKYVTGTPIYVTVQNNETGELNSLATLSSPAAVGMVNVYYCGTTEVTESDLQITAPDTAFNFDIPNTAWSLHGKNIDSPKYLTFTPNQAGYYAVQYVNAVSPSTTYAYKVIKVETSSN
mgnify:CR=1 FL=1